MSGKKTKAEERQQRLARALKRNIALRKAEGQPPARDADPPDPDPEENGCPN